MRIGYVFASRERPVKFFNCLENIRNKSENDNYFVIAAIDNDDPKLKEYCSPKKNYPEVTMKFGISKNKVHAINRAAENLPPCDIVCCHSDDMVFTKLWFDVLIREAMKIHFPDTDGFLHFPDQKNAEKLCTYNIVGRKYFDRTGYIYNPAYESLFCDKEETEKAKLLKKYAYIAHQIIEHRHPRCGIGFKDALLKRTDSPEVYTRDRMTFVKRKLENFGI